MGKHEIAIGRYGDCLMAWIGAAKRSTEDREQMTDALAALRVKFGDDATEPADVFCRFMQQHAGRRGWPIDLRKSNLLWRLIYGGESLRSRECPTHKGRWSGMAWNGDECACAGGGCITGWLPEAADFRNHGAAI